MDLKLNSNRILITGASKGIRYATALAFAREGAAPVLVSRDKDALEVAVQRIQRQTSVAVDIHVADLAEDTIREELHRQFKSVDVLVNNACAVPGPLARSGYARVAQCRYGWS